MGETLLSKHKQPPRPTDSQAGVALLVGVMAFLLFGLSLFAGLRWLGPHVDLERQQAVSARLTGAIQKSLWSFVSRNKRLPCAADGSNADPNSPTYGQEDCQLTNLGAGIVPWKTLGLSQTQAQDSWGNMIGYAVTGELSSGKPFNANTPTSDDVQVSIGGATTSYAYVLMSFGPDGGGFNSNGKQTSSTSSSKLPAAETLHEADNRQAITNGGAATAFVGSAVSGGATGAQALVYETSKQICADINGKRQLYCGSFVDNNGLTQSGAGFAPLAVNQGLAVTTAATGNPNGKSSNSTVVSSGANAPVLVLGTGSNSPTITTAPTLSDNSQACSWANIPLTLTTQTMRAYFEFSTVGNTTPGHGFTFTLLPGSTDITTTTPCGGTPNGVGAGPTSGTITNEGSYLGFEAIVDGGQNGTATAAATVDANTTTISRIDPVLAGAGYSWVPPVEITGAGMGATAYVSAVKVSPLNGIVVTGAGYGYIAAVGADVRPPVYVAPAGGLGYPATPNVTIETAEATGCISGCVPAKAQAVMSGTTVSKLSILQAGSGYMRAPAVQIDSAITTGCLTACADAIGASATLNGGSVSALFISGDTCGTGCTANTGGQVNSMGVTGVLPVLGGSGYLSPPGGAGFSATPSVLIFNNNGNNPGLGQGANWSAAQNSGVVTGYGQTSVGAGYSSVSVTVAGGGVAYFTIGGINNGGVSSLTLADSGQVPATSGQGTYTELGSTITVALPAPVHCSTGCASAVISAAVSSGGYILGNPAIIYAGSGYDTNYDLGNYVPVTDSAHQPALATATLSGTGVTGLDLPTTAVPQAPAITVITDNLDVNKSTIVPANISATVSQAGVITGLLVNSAGSGYTRVPTINIDWPADCANIPSCSRASAQISSMGVLGIGTLSTNDSYSAMPSVGIDPPIAASCNGICYAAAASANITVTGITMGNPGSGYVQGSTNVSLPPPLMLPKVAIEFRTYHHPPDPAYSDYGYHDDWGFFGYNTPSLGANATIKDALAALLPAQTVGIYGSQIQMPLASVTPQPFTDNIRHDDNNDCDASTCIAQYMAGLVVDSLHRDNTYHYSTNTLNHGTANGPYTISPSCDFPSTGNPAQHGGGFVAGGVSTGGAVASIVAAATSATAPYAGGCTFDTASGTPILTQDGPITVNENGTLVHYHRVRVEAQRYCDPTCSSCGNKGTPGNNYIQVAAYLDCDSVALGGASCSDMSQNLLVQGSQVFFITLTDPGANYSVAPTIAFVGGGGKGATAIAHMKPDNSIDYIEVTSRGTGYRSAPTVVFSSGTAAATASITGLPFPASYAANGGTNVYAMNYCTVDPGATTFTASQRGLAALDYILAGFTVGADTAATANRGVLLRNILVGTYGN